MTVLVSLLRHEITSPSQASDNGVSREDKPLNQASNRLHRFRVTTQTWVNTYDRNDL